MAILTISREFGSGAKGIGEAVAQAVGYEYVDRKRMLDELEKEGPAFKAWTKQFEEHDPSAWGTYDWSFRGFVALFQSLILSHAKTDRVVISATGAGCLLRGTPYALRVLMKAPLESRVTRVQGDDVVSRETAKWIIEKADEEMTRAIYAIYGRGWDDPSEYDMVFDTSERTKDQIVRDIAEALVLREAHNTEKARKALEMRALAAKIKAVIAIDPKNDATTLEVEPKEEGLPEYGIVIKGIVREQADIKEMEEVARALAGDVPVESHLVYRSYSRLGPWQFK
jgi:cytidylate kinase